MSCQCFFLHCIVFTLRCFNFVGCYIDNIHTNIVHTPNHREPKHTRKPTREKWKKKTRKKQKTDWLLLFWWNELVLVLYIFYVNHLVFAFFDIDAACSMRSTRRYTTIKVSICSWRERLMMVVLRTWSLSFMSCDLFFGFYWHISFRHLSWQSIRFLHFCIFFYFFLVFVLSFFNLKQKFMGERWTQTLNVFCVQYEHPLRVHRTDWTRLAWLLVECRFRNLYGLFVFVICSNMNK